MKPMDEHIAPPRELRKADFMRHFM